MAVAKKKPNPPKVHVVYENEATTATYIAGLKNLEISDISFLDRTSQVLNKAYHYAFARLQAGDEPNALKRSCIGRFGISGRHYNGNLGKIENKVKTAKKARNKKISSIKRGIKNQKTYLEKIVSPEKHWQKGRYIHRLQDKLTILEQDAVERRTRVAFGSKKLFRAQFHLEANGYQNHQEWKEDWTSARNQSFIIIGSKDESTGSQLCNATINDNDNINLRLRLPDCLVENGIQYLYLKDIQFSYGHEHILASIVANLERKSRRKLETRLRKQGILSSEELDKYKEMGTSIAYIFKKSKKNKWQVHVTVDVPKPEEWYSRAGKEVGAIGVDINVDHLAISETDRFGNLVSFDSIPLCTYGLSRHQSLALIGEKAKELVAYAISVRKPLVLEKLDFKDKQAILEKANPKTARMLSSFAYKAIINFIKARAFREGIHCYQVNPAYTSVIGRCKYAKALGITIHQSAALVIARRFLGFSEKPLTPSGNLLKVPIGDGDYATLDVPVRNRRRHEWSLWGSYFRKLKPALAAHYRTRRAKAALAAKARKTSRPSRSSSGSDAIKSSSVVEPVSSSFDLVGENPTRESSSNTVEMASTLMTRKSSVFRQ